MRITMPTSPNHCHTKAASSDGWRRRGSIGGVLHHSDHGCNALQGSTIDHVYLPDCRMALTPAVTKTKRNEGWLTRVPIQNYRDELT